MKVKEFYQFFLKNKVLPDSELADKVIIKFGLSQDKAEVIDLIQTTRIMCC